VVIFAIPAAQKTFMLDSSNMVITSMALGIGLLGAAVIEVLWWVQGALMGERRRLWRSS
jgi:cation-transporting ATPase E